MQAAVVLVLCSLFSGSLSETPVIRTLSGLIQGNEITIADQNLTLYYGIPYAEAPIGSLRFKPPVPVQFWPGVLQAIEKPLPCIQQSITGFAYSDPKQPTSEDCLKLNVLVPHSQFTNASVLVYLHGGAFAVGDGTYFLKRGSILALEENIILVSVNYRLNIFGFLNLGDVEAPGNVGLMDQHEGLVWIKKNIEAFGGNPNSITVLGMSAGSCSVGYHILANKQEKLFQRAILMSGVPTYPIHTEPEEVISKSKKLASAVGCMNSSTVLECLRKIPAQDLVDAENKLLLTSHDFFRPTVDGIYVTEDTKVTLESGRFRPVPLLIGVTSNEGSRFVYSQYHHLFTGTDATLTAENFKRVLGLMLGPDANVATVEAAELFYKNFTNPEDEYMLRDGAARAYGDQIFVCGVNYFCDQYFKAGGIIYKYVYDQKVFGVSSMDWMGPDHSTDLPIVLGATLFSGVNSNEEQEFSRKLMKQWSSFIRTGDPNIADVESPKWPKYNSVHRPHMKLAFHSQVQGHFRVRECSFWHQLLPSLRTAGKC